MGQTARTTERWWKTGAISLLVSVGLLSGVTASASASPARTEAVVVARPGQLASAERAVEAAGGRITSELSSLDTITTVIDPADLSSVAASPSVVSATPDGNLTLQSNSASYDPAQDPYSLASIEASTGIRSLWANETGAGVGVALIDSGVTQVPGYLDQIVQGPNFSDSHRSGDTFGHGTFMAGIIAGDQGNSDPVANAANREDFLGVAPSSTLVSVKVADSQGNTSLSQILQGINWVINNRSTDNIRVINLSFGTMPQDAYVNDPLAWAVEQAWQAGIVVVVSAGNGGATSGRLDDPAYDPYVIAVGAEDIGTNGSSPSVASFSSWGDGTRNPDFVAPGAHIQSLVSADSYIDLNFAATGLINQTFFRGSGTSEAAAFTSGLAALLVQEHPTFTPNQIKALMVSTASPIAGADPRAQGAGAVRPAAALGPISHSTASAIATSQSFPTAAPTAAPTGASPADSAHCVAVGTGANSSKADLRGRNLQGANLANPSAAGADTHGASFGTGNGTGNGTAQFLKTVTGNVESPPMEQACTTAGGTLGSSWSGSSWSGSSWSGSSWSGSSWSGSSWSGSSWSGSSWSGSSWSGSSWSGSSWSTATWS